MNRKHRKKDLRALCAEIHEDDAVDPRLAFSRRQSSEARKENRKTFQLCKQVARALGAVLSDDCRDEALRDVEIVDVVPAPNSGRLAVLVRLDRLAKSAATDETAARLNLAAGFLRAQIASAITRKRVPELTFRFVSGEEEAE